MPSIRIRSAFALALLLAALAAGLYLSGWLTLWWLALPLPTHLDTYWHYARALHAPQVQPYAGRIKAAGGVGFGLPLLAWMLLAIPLLRPRARATHGDARFAGAGALARQRMLSEADRSIVVGRLGRKLVRLPGQQHVILAAPSRSGKGVGVVIPNLLSYSDSMVVLDIKGENHEITSGWRASQGQAVYRFDPYSEHSHRWNPLHAISLDPRHQISDVQSIAQKLYPDGAEQDRFWVSQSRNAFAAFALYLFDHHAYLQDSGFPGARWPTLGEIHRLAAGDGSDLRAFVAGLASQPFVRAPTRTAFAGLTSQAEETFASIMGSLRQPLNQWISPILDAATSDSDFRLCDVRRRRMTVYVTIAPNKLDEARQILNLFFAELVAANTGQHQLPQNDPTLKYQCLLLMDEFTAAGRVDIIASTIGHSAGYNLRKLLVVQSMSQLDATYGKEEARTLMTNCALQIVYAPREQRDANDYSEMLGTTTVRRRNRSRSHGASSGVSFSEVEEKRALMLPQELKAMGGDTQIVFYEGIGAPVKCGKIRYYSDRHFRPRLLPPVATPRLDLARATTA
jgi:type IV secretion system protein VirD4